MAPKNTAAAKTTKADQAFEAMKAAELAQSRRDHSNMITQLKNPKGSPEDIADKKALWTMYSALDHRSPEKAGILAKWLTDKSCKWQNSYRKERQISTNRVSNTVGGHGTKC